MGPPDRPACVSDLPVDVLHAVLSQLGLVDVMRAARVCRVLRHAALSLPGIWESLEVAPSARCRSLFGPRHPETHFYQLLLQRGYRQNLKRVRIEVRRRTEFDHPAVRDEDLGAAFLRSLGALPEDGEPLALEEVSLDSTALSDADLATLAVHGRPLRSCDLGGCELISGIGFSRFVAACTRLETLSFAVGPLFRERLGIQALCTHCGPSLRQLTIEGLGRHGEPFCSLSVLAASAPNLERLSLTEAFFTESLLGGLEAALRSLPRLTALSFTTDFSLERVQYVRLAEACSRLSELRLGAPHKKNAADAGLAALLRSCRQLRSLAFAGVDEDTVRVMEREGLPPSLERLELGIHAGTLLDRELPAVLGACCPRLKALALEGSGYELAERRVLRPLAEACPALESLRLSDAASVLDGDLIALAVKCPLLEELALCEGARISDSAVLFAATHLRRLRAVDLTRCAGLTDASVSALLASARGLESLRVQGCPLLTLVSLEAVGDRGARLRTLDFSTRQFAPGALDEIRRLSERRPDLWSPSCGLPAELGDWDAPRPPRVARTAAAAQERAAEAASRERGRRRTPPPPGGGYWPQEEYPHTYDADPDGGGEGCSMQ
eukprot:tig00000733_g3774.t1